MKTLKTILLATCTMAATATAKADAATGLSMSAVAFADYYWVAAHHAGQYQNLNGVQIRRVWLTGDKDLSEKLSARLRLEMAGGDFSSATASTWTQPLVKDLWMKWAWAEGQSLSFGIIEGAALGFVEKSWGLRSVEKSPLDLQAWVPTREQGLSFNGSLGKSSYQLVYSNGANNLNQGSDNGKKVQLALTQGLGSLSFTLFGDVKSGLDGSWAQPVAASGSSYAYTLQAFAAFKSEALRAGLLYARQTGVRPTFGDESSKELLSGHLIARVWGSASAFARADHLLWNSLDKGGQPYLQLARLRSTVFIAGLDYPVAPGLRLQPNVEWIHYQSDAAANAAGVGSATADCIPRMTVSYQF